jgi:hypothetical protein
LYGSNRPSPCGSEYGKILGTEHLAGIEAGEPVMSNKQRDGHPWEPNDSSRQLAELKEECARLQQVVKRLEEEKKRDAEALAAAISALNESHRSALKWAAEQWSEEDWRDFKEEDYTLAPEDVIAELEGQEGP